MKKWSTPIRASFEWQRLRLRLLSNPAVALSLDGPSKEERKEEIFPCGSRQKSAFLGMQQWFC